MQEWIKQVLESPQFGAAVLPAARIAGGVLLIGAGFYLLATVGR